MSEYTSYFTDEIVHLEAHTGFTSGGQLPKAWNIERTVLYKGEQHLGTTFCVYSEVICSHLAEMLGIPHVAYWLESHEYTVGSSSKVYKAPLVLCNSFADKNHVPISLYDVLVKNNCTQSQAVNYIRNIDLRLHCMMLLFDFIIANPDRHLRNLGLLKYNNTLSILPLYDHDKALYSTRINHSGEPFSRVDVYESERLYQTYMLNLIRIAKTLLTRDKLLLLCPWERLFQCDDIVNQYDNIPEERRNSIISMIKLRTHFMLEELHK